MVCFQPIKCYLPFDLDAQGKKRLIFSEQKVNEIIINSNLAKKYVNNSFSLDVPKLIVSSDYGQTGFINGIISSVPCGKCIGCRNDNARRWSARCYNEAQSVGVNNCCFVTLTFNNKMLFNRVNPWSLDKSAFSGFLKRLRKRIKYTYNIDNVRFFCVGEYGSKKSRPHYHLLLFGFNFPDKKVLQGVGVPQKLQPHIINGRLIRNYYSDFLNSCWSPAYSDESFGFSVISDLTYEDCAYTARYCLKKLGNFNKSINRESEFINSSRNPGIGYDFFKKYYKNILSLGYIDLGNNRRSDIPRYYIDKLKDIDYDYYEKYLLDKRNFLIDNLFHEVKDLSEQRLLAKEELLNQKLEKYVREYELDLILHNI